MKGFKYTDKELSANLRLIAEDIGHMPTQAEYDAHPLRLSCSVTYRCRFGTWYNACKKTGYSISSKQAITKKNKSTAELEEAKIVLLSELFNAITQHPNISISAGINKWTNHAFTTYIKYFGSINHIRLLLKQHYGVNMIIKRGQKIIMWTKAIIEEEFKRIATLLKHSPTWSEMIHLTIYKNIGAGIRKVYGSYTALSYALNYKTKERKLTTEALKRKKQYYTKKLRTAYRDADKDKNKYTGRDWVKICSTNKTSIHDYFGSMQNWFKEAHIPIPKTMKTRNNDPVKDACKTLRKLTKKLKHAPSIREYNALEEKPCHSVALIRKLKSWNNVLKTAGIKPKYIRYYTNEALIASIQETCKRLKHIPRYREYLKLNEVPSMVTICSRFGSWDKALIAAGLK